MNPPVRTDGDAVVKAVGTRATATAAASEEAPRELLARAWALKDECYAAWSTDPRRAVQAAAALRALCGPASDTFDTREIRALAAWTEGIAHVTQGRMAEAVQSLDAAAGTWRSLGRAEHAAQTQVPKIMALSILGQFDAAIDCAEAAQHAFKALGDKHGAAKVNLNLSSLLTMRGHHVRAVGHAREASVLYARAGDLEGSVQADVALAHAQADLGDFDEATRVYARARMRAKAHDFPVLQTFVDEAQGLLNLARGRFNEALTALESARRLYELLAMPHNVAGTEKHLADVYLELHLLPEALALYEKALARLQALDVPDAVAWTLAQRGRTQALLGQSAAAAESFERAQALFVEHRIDVGEAAVGVARAELALDAGYPAMATRLAARAGEAFAAAGRIEGRIRSDVVRAHALLRAGSVEQARALFAATQALAHTLQMSSVLVRCRVGQGLAAQAMGDADAAREAYLEAVELFETQRHALPGDDLRSAFLTDHLLPFRELLRLALAAHAEKPSPATAMAVLQHLEQVRARSLADQLSDARAQADNDDGTAALRERLNWLYRQVHRLDATEAPSSAMNEELRRTEFELLERARRDRMVRPAETPKGSQADGTLDVSALHAHLGPGDALVEYGVLDDELFACVVSADGVVVERHVASWSEAQEAMRATRFQIETLRHGPQSVEQHLASLTARVTKRLERVRDLVWQPIAPHVARRRRLMVVPCGALASLPFAALPLASVATTAPRVLSERFVIAVVPSARLALYGLQRSPAIPRHVVALGESGRLEHAAAEACQVAAMFDSSATLIGDGATAQALAGHAPSADVLHLACHAQFRTDNPRFSALHLHDAALSVEAVERLSLRPCTVVLSACDTGLQAGGAGEESVGLVRAFLAAGAARVVASLWPVDDSTTAAFMRDFYTELRQGLSPADALRRAQLKRRETCVHPFFWAAFVLAGGW